MSGVFSLIFDPASDEDSSSQHNIETGLDSGGDLDLTIDQDVGLELGVTYQDDLRETHSWHVENDVGIHADAGATVNAIILADQDSTII